MSYYQTLTATAAAPTGQGRRVCLVLGAGPGIGYSCARQWAGQPGWQVVITRRSAPPPPSELAQNVAPGVVQRQCDVTNRESVQRLVEAVETEFGPVHTCIYNAGYGVFKKYDAITTEMFEQGFATNALGLLITAQVVCPRMVERGGGVLAVTGATASLRGKAFTAGFAPSKAAQRILAQSLARDLGPRGVHVFYAVIDGLVFAGEEKATAAGVPLDPEKRDKQLNPADVAAAYWHTAQQPRSAWTQELDLRPYCENW